MNNERRKVVMNVGKIINSGVKVLKNNSTVLLQAGLFGGVFFLAAKMNVPISIGTNNITVCPKSDYEIPPILTRRSVSEQSILTMLRSSKNMVFDSDRARIARNIAKIAIESESSIDKSAALYALEDIADRMIFDSGRREVIHLIAEVGESDNPFV